MLDHWRARVGWIHPRVNSDIEVYDFYTAAPDDVVLVVTHLEVVDSSRKEEVEASLELLERAVERLHLAKVDFIIKNGAPVHLHHGNDGHQKILARMRAVSEVPVTTSSQAVADAFHSLGAKQIMVVSSWPAASAHLSSNLRNHLASEGIEVAAVEGIGKEMKSFEKIQMTPAEIFANAVSAAKKHTDVDAIYIQSGTMATVGILDELEHEIGKPVVSSNSANIWGSFKPLGIKTGPGFGALLASI
jgi:maleate cis-trans isomerase